MRSEQSFDVKIATASTVGSAITRAQTLERCQFWVRNRVTYTQTGPWAPDPQGKTYRRDCSGLVSMAWHLPTSHTTYTFDSWSGKMVLPSLHDLRPGDALLKSGHIELFARWVNPGDHDKGAYVYSFNRNGETVENPDAKSNFGNLGRNSWSDLTTYRPIRYRNIGDTSPPAGPTGSVLREPNGAISVVVGGVPFHLNPEEYAALGSPAFSSVPAGTFERMPTIIANGTLVRGPDGAVYIVAGSAKYHLSRAEYVALSSPPFVNVPVRLLAALDSSPNDNTFLRDAANGAIYQIAGNAKYYLGPADYSSLGSPAATNVPVGFINSITVSIPSQPVFLRDPANGAVFEVVGGAKYHVTPAEYAALGSPQFTNVPAGFINRIGTTPADGTFLRDVASGAIYQIIGGAKYHLSPYEYSALDSTPATNVPAGFLDAITRTIPVAGFMRKTGKGEIYQLVNGAKYHLRPDEYAALGSPMAIDAPAGFIERAAAIPADGSFLRDIASGLIVEIVGGASYPLTAAEYASLGRPAFTNVPVGFIHSITETLPRGTIFLWEPSSHAIYQVVAGAKYHLNPDEYAALGKPAFIAVPTGLLDRLGAVPTGDVHLRNVADDVIYLVSRGVKYPLTDDAWYALPDHVYTDVTQGFLDAIPAS
jgi:hypothetical protein